MVKLFLKERQSWLVFFLCIHSLLLFIAYLDASINITSIAYYTFLSTILFIGFLVYRYQRETIFYKELKELDPTMDLSEMREANLPFEKVVQTALVHHIQYQKRRQSAHTKELELEKEEMLAWIHEVKTPLTAMKLMMDRLDDPKVKKQITYEWLRIHLLLDQQLHRRRIPSMENDLYMEKVDMEALIFDEIKTLQSWCIQKGIGFDVELSERNVVSDSKWLSFIIRQLLTNAVKYSHSGDIEIKSFTDDGLIILSITDHGLGISSRDLPRIFDKGFTSTSNHHNQAATGMGLFLAKRAADALSIYIDVKSTPAQGSTFILTFSRNNEFVDIWSM
ncbi:sensor histidine kinase [Sutcliffiella horikoshii]|uniref:sensor histidine kinase n=1 Tax=Sutcliffiella horikoshii TaxID=79883 RepID=UPI001F2740DE|nr:sensor histidine kinase [Sutcliffiella horikoshii]MCG1021189.1 HAMP domain-containing histidine kinase [Sutcliffiella horikoshii]